jgi:hypothetical protein
MTAGKLTFSGSFYVARVDITAGNPSPVKFEVHKPGFLGIDTTICSTTVTPSKMTGSAYAKSFSISCGNISAGNYYIFLAKTIAAGDGYDLVGSGTLRTP